MHSIEYRKSLFRYRGISMFGASLLNLREVPATYTSGIGDRGSL